MIENTSDYIIDFWLLLEWAKQTRREINKKNICNYWIPILDKYLWWILLNELLVIGWWTGAWKSEMAYILAFNNAIKWKKVLLMSLEWDIYEPAYRYIQNQINKNKLSDNKDMIRTGNFRFNVLSTLNEDEDKVIENTLNSLKTNLKLFNKKHIPNLEFLKEFIIKTKDNFDMFIIDHLHYIHFMWDKENQEISNIMRELKAITDIIHKPIILISHLRKPKDDKEPTEFDLHGSSNIPKEATTILLLQKSDYDLSVNSDVYRDNKNYSYSKIILRKSRIWLWTIRFSLVYDRHKKEYIYWEMLEQESDITYNDKILIN